jgi:hypothetical protein
MRLVIFLSIVLSVVGGSHYYFWLRLVRDTGLPVPWRAAATAGLVALALSLPLSFILMRTLRPEVARVALFPIYLWMGIMLLLLAGLFFADVLKLAYSLLGRVVRYDSALDPERRVFLARAVALSTLAAVTAATGMAVHSALSRVVVKRLRIELPGLPPALDGTTIAQITDLHLGATLGREWLREVVNRVNALSPDLVAVTGDLVDGSVDFLRPVVAPIAGLRSRYGVFFVTGNHEYYSGAASWMAELPRLGLRVLRNERVSIGSAAASFDLAGIDDWNARGMAPGHGPDLPRALLGRDPSRALVLLAHQPRAIFEAARLGVGLQLSGHTHGGQLWPWSLFVRLQQPVVSGLRRFHRTDLYVSEGTGFWGPPLRLGTTSEITLITLVAPRGPR